MIIFSGQQTNYIMYYNYMVQVQSGLAFLSNTARIVTISVKHSFQLFQESELTK